MERLEKKLDTFYEKHKAELPKLAVLALVLLYFYGMLVRFISVGTANTFGGGDTPAWTLNPFTNLLAVFSPSGLGLAAVTAILAILFSGKGKSWLSGTKTTKDRERNIEILSEGTHGTSNWLTRKEMRKVFDVDDIRKISTPLLGKLQPDSTDSYVGIRTLPGLNKNIMVYGAPGTGKSRGFVKPFIMQAVRRGESVILTDPKGEFYESYSEWLGTKGYTVRAYNLLDMVHSDAWNCLNDTALDKNLVQSVAEIIINNTSGEGDKSDFWSKSEKNLLMALMLYVQTLCNPSTGELLPIEQRSLGAIYKLLANTSFNELDRQFSVLREQSPGHPALPPYGIFKQAGRQLWGNIAIGLGSRLNVFQNEMVDKITSYNEIDLELPGKQKCAYFCIISDQDSSMEFLSSLFFSLLFVKLSDYARKHGEGRRLPVEVNIVLDEFSNIGKLLDFKRTISTVRSRGINCQVIIQSVAQLANRYPHTEWEEIVGSCDTQLFLGCNDRMTAEFISKQCGDATVRINNVSEPMAPLFSPVINSTRPYTHMQSSAGRPLMFPDEVRRLPGDQEIVFVRGLQALRLYKIVPEELPGYQELVDTHISGYMPEWRKQEAVPSGAPSPDKHTEPVPASPQEADVTATQCEEVYIPLEETDLHTPGRRKKGIDCRQEAGEISPDDI